MKKVTFFIVIIIMVFTAMAQTKVAILETVDKAQNVNYGVKLLLRSSLTSAISNTPGYEGYDRVDMASIAGEQEFQRTGNVSDNQIKQLGVATGAAYVLVAEAAMYDEESIIITAKLLDVETFGVKNSAVLVSGVSADKMQASCNSLAVKLLGGSNFVNTITTKNQTTTIPIEEPTKTTVVRRNTSDKSQKNPFVAGLCSFFIPGLGQMYNGEFLKGALFLGGFIGGFILANNTNSYEYEYDYYGSYSYEESTNSPLFAVGLITCGVAWLWSLIDAPISANRINRQNSLAFTLGDNTMLCVNPTIINTSSIGMGKSFVSGLSFNIIF